MKKIFALVVALGAMTAVFAQRDYDHRDESRDVILGGPARGVYNNGYDDPRDRREQIEHIRREYAWRIESVEHNEYLRRGERRRQIRFLENERDERIREVMRHDNYRGYRGYNRHDRHDRDDHDRDDYGRY